MNTAGLVVMGQRRERRRSSLAGLIDAFRETLHFFSDGGKVSHSFTDSVQLVLHRLDSKMHTDVCLLSCCCYFYHRIKPVLPGKLD